MAAPVPRFHVWWLWGKKKEEVATSDDESSSDWEKKAETVKSAAASARRMRKKWKRREEKVRVDREHDIVLIPSDGGCLSGSESDDSDWSIGWLEPHASDFLSEDDGDDDSFAVLVPCYRINSKSSDYEPSRNHLFATPNNHFTGEKIHGAVAYFPS